MKKLNTIVHKTPQDQFFYEMQVRKTLIHRAARDFIYSRHLYSLPVTDLSELGVEVRFALFELLQLNLAKLFTDNKNQKYNVHRLLAQLRSKTFLPNHIPNDKLQLLADRLTSFQSTILGLQTTRDEWIAHTDALGGFAPLDSFFPTIEALLQLGFELLDASSQAILHTPVYNNLHVLLPLDLQLLKKAI